MTGGGSGFTVHVVAMAPSNRRSRRLLAAAVASFPCSVSSAVRANRPEAGQSLPRRAVQDVMTERRSHLESAADATGLLSLENSSPVILSAHQIPFGPPFPLPLPHVLKTD
ncbi:putative cellulose synthase A catalytic subunit 8 [UDP-forming] [Iris pallida]|uniref:Cellulose synthase A catalytic subunit 8 [UDP-forming] n=1 Tax=Iris pallida TaxID=29817 RepID=A0AAX6FLI2_IRIPA|nr:putative cellulose synthase A catalytic subunit 8 [UDP-forming] [Iris pallida]